MLPFTGTRPASSQHVVRVEPHSVHGHHRRHNQHGGDPGGVHQQGGGAAGGERGWVKPWPWKSWCRSRPPTHPPTAPPPPCCQSEGEIGLFIWGERPCRGATRCTRDGRGGGLHRLRQGRPAQPGHRGGGGELRRVPGGSKLPKVATATSLSWSAWAKRGRWWPSWSPSCCWRKFFRWQSLFIAQPPAPPGERPVILPDDFFPLIWVDFVR